MQENKLLQETEGAVNVVVMGAVTVCIDNVGVSLHHLACISEEKNCLKNCRPYRLRYDARALPNCV